MTYPVCYDEDTDRFIIELMKDHFEGRIYSGGELNEIKQDAGDYSACIEGYTSYSQRYSLEDLRLIIETDGAVMKDYKLRFINDQVIVTLKTITYIYES
jgi:hypothetical protein